MKSDHWKRLGSLCGVPIYGTDVLGAPDTRTTEEIAVAAAMHGKRMEAWPKKLDEHWPINLKADIAE